MGMVLLYPAHTLSIAIIKSYPSMHEMFLMCLYLYCLLVNYRLSVRGVQAILKRSKLSSFFQGNNNNKKTLKKGSPVLATPSQAAPCQHTGMGVPVFRL
jgi:hypothetical protein